jgi:hypothetical protein
MGGMWKESDSERSDSTMCSESDTQSVSGLPRAVQRVCRQQVADQVLREVEELTQTSLSNI